MERLEGTNALNQGAGAEPRAPPSAESHHATRLRREAI